MMRVVIRADASDKIGAGHVMRCLALAQALLESGAEVLFVTSCSWPQLLDYLKGKLDQVISFEYPESLLGDSADLQKFLAVAHGFDWIVLDNYYFDRDYQRQLRAAGSRLLVIDDIPTRSFCADIVLNHSIAAHSLDYLPQPEMKLLLGAQYALIRKELLAYHQNPVNKRYSRVLVTLGGGSHTKAWNTCIEAFELLQDLEIQVKIIAGFSAAQAYTNLRQSAARVEIIPPSFDNFRLYEWADIAVCAAGGTVGELCFFGVPGIVGVLADNQTAIADAVAKANAFVNVGWYEKHSATSLAQIIRQLITNAQQIQSMRQKAAQLVDGQGSRRVAEAMQEVFRGVC